MNRSFAKRLADLEQARWEQLTPLERAFELLERGTPPAQWPDAELEAYCETECQHLLGLTDAQVEALVDAPEGQLADLYIQFTGEHPHTAYLRTKGEPPSAA
jgi:hypothetical protein